MILTFLLTVAESQSSSALNTNVVPMSELSFGWTLVRVIFAMMLVSGLAFFVIKYLMPKSPWVKNLQGSKIQILEKASLEPRKNLYLVQVAEKVVLVGTSEQSLSALLELSVQEYQNKTFSVSEQNHEAKKA